MEAGIEHLGRATSGSVDCLIVVVEPGRRSIDTALKIKDLARDIALERVFLAGNKIRSRSDQDFLRDALSGFRFLGFIPYDDHIIEADLHGAFPEDMEVQTLESFKEIAQNVMDLSTKSQ
jgi:CO dehydrogenase maturation factor